MSNQTRYPPLAPLALIALAAVLPGQNDTPQAELQKRWADKQQEAWFQDGGWIHDFDAAKAKAAKEGKVIFAYFSRSYAP